MAFNFGKESSVGLVFEIEVDTKTGEARLKRFGDVAQGTAREVEGAGATMSGAFSSLRSGLIPVVGAITAVAGAAYGMISVFRTGIAFMRDSADAAAEQEVADRRLASALLSVGIQSEATFNRLRDQAGELQRGIGISDDAAQRYMALAIQMGVSTDQAARFVEAAQDIVTVTGRDMSRVLRALAGVAADGGEGVKTLGIGLDATALKGKSFAEVLDAVNAKVGGATRAQMQTYEGSLKAIGLAWGELQENVGNLIAQSPSLRLALGGVADGLNGITGSIQANNDILKPAIVTGLDFAVLLAELGVRGEQTAAGLRKVGGVLWFFAQNFTNAGALASNARTVLGVLDTIVEKLGETEMRGDSAAEKALERLRQLRADVLASSGKLEGVTLANTRGAVGSALPTPPQGRPWSEASDDVKAFIGQIERSIAAKQKDADTTAILERMGVRSFQSIAGEATQLNRDVEILTSGFVDGTLKLEDYELAIAGVIGKYESLKKIAGDGSLPPLNTPGSFAAFGGASQPSAPGPTMDLTGFEVPETSAEIIARNTAQAALDTEMALKQISGSFATFEAQFIASSAVMLGAGQGFATALGNTYATLNAMSQTTEAVLGKHNSLAMGLRKILGGMMIVTGIADIIEGWSRIFKSYFSDGTGYALVAQGAAAVAQGKAMGGSGGSGAGAGPPGAGSFGGGKTSTESGYSSGTYGGASSSTGSQELKGSQPSGRMSSESPYAGSGFQEAGTGSRAPTGPPPNAEQRPPNVNVYVTNQYNVKAWDGDSVDRWFRENGERISRQAWDPEVVRRHLMKPENRRTSAEATVLEMAGR